VSKQEVTLHDRYDLEKSQVLLNGTQALVRLTMMQKALDTAAGLNTAGYVTGYRGSPVGAVDLMMTRAGKDLSACDVKFEPGLNEDLAATALWGSQQAELRGEGKFDGVFGLWYGKGPGVDRTGDVMRHANMAGTAPHGGVVMCMGDDHTGESSTTLHQSDWAMVDAYMPVLSPAGVQEVIDYGLYGWALSRYAGVWVGLKLMKDTIEATAVVDGSLERHGFATPDLTLPPGGLNIRLGDTPVAQEARMIDYKRHAAEAFARVNGIDKRVLGAEGAKIGFVAAGKNWLDLTHALSLLGLNDEEALRLGITTYKVGQVWPLDMQSFHEWAEGLDLIVVVEEKRKLIEVQVKEAIFDDRRGRRVYGWYKEGGEELFPTRYALDPNMVARKIGTILQDEGRGSDHLLKALQLLDDAEKADNAPELATRMPWFCSGCPHNSSTRLPEGSRAYAGIGCHYMVQWMDRETTGFTQMGGEGANWIGEAPFSTRDHVFQNLGDGTYNHSGVQAIRAALAANTSITYKILFNDAVAMTGGQDNEGGLTAPRIARELVAMGVEHVALVYDVQEEIDFSQFPKSVSRHERGELMNVQRDFSKIKGVSAIVYVQTCAAEKRRRRKKGAYPDPDKRAFINTDICEGCGDCGVQSNCVSIVPVETELGRKRAIDQSSCNKDFSCVSGFCPSFVTIEGAQIRKSATAEVDTGSLTLPQLPAIDGTFNTVITGVGGTGVVTIGALMAMAAHLDGKGVGLMEMAGLAQKGGAVHIHCRIAETPDDISAIRVATGECDTLIGGDLVVSAGSKTMGLLKPGAGAVVNSHEIITGQFTQDAEFKLPMGQMQLSLEARLQQGMTSFDASELARKVLGDSIFSNMMVFGASWQRGLIPLSFEAIERAIELNGTAVERNKRAFELGRWAVENLDAVASLLHTEEDDAPIDMEGKIEFREAHLTAYQNARLAKRYRRFVDQIADPELRETVALSYHKLLSYKDEYEVSRLLAKTGQQARDAFSGDLKLTYHLAPPVLPGKDALGRPKKREFGPRMAGLIMGLARFKFLRGTPFDPFGYAAERRLERRLIREFEADINRLMTRDDFGGAQGAELAALPMSVRGFGLIKTASAEAASKRRAELWSEIEAPEGPAEIAQAAE
jgi:indolepyruvate ferredoxin oxidoreductase